MKILNYWLSIRGAKISTEVGAYLLTPGVCRNPAVQPTTPRRWPSMKNIRKIEAPLLLHFVTLSRLFEPIPQPLVFWMLIVCQCCGFVTVWNWVKCCCLKGKHPIPTGLEPALNCSVCDDISMAGSPQANLLWMVFFESWQSESLKKHG
eukprot:Lithocolla_globosa_v1_NODE_67_length_7144_cov_10.886601.p3 type:complete len:149 gc:universal NODE_67_length_7144_cov_10.886601:3801-3355(-)